MKEKNFIYDATIYDSKNGVYALDPNLIFATIAKYFINYILGGTRYEVDYIDSDVIEIMLINAITYVGNSINAETTTLTNDYLTSIKGIKMIDENIILTLLFDSFSIYMEFESMNFESQYKKLGSNSSEEKMVLMDFLNFIVEQNNIDKEFNVNEILSGKPNVLSKNIKRR